MHLIKNLLGVVHGRTNSGELLTVHKIATAPTLALVFMSLCFGLMLYFAARYQVNVAYGIAFLGFVMLGTAAWRSFRVLHGLALSVQPKTKPCHAGEPMDFEFDIQETQGRKRQHLIVHVGPKQYEIALDPYGKVRLSFSVPAHERGELKAALVRLSTPYPIGLWNTHHLWRPDQTGVVYPAIELQAPELAGIEFQGEGEITNFVSSNSGDALVGLRRYAPGDSMRRVAWRLYAKTNGQTLVTKQAESAGGSMDDLWVEEEAACHLFSPEHRLSRLTAWLHQADKTGRPYGMNALGLRIEPDLGQDHLDQCLTILALAPGYATRTGFDIRKKNQ